MKILSKWQQEVGKWDRGLNDYVDRKVIELPDKFLVMQIIRIENRNILRFNGGPTGFESYHIPDLIDGMKTAGINKIFCICGGTINRWPHCTVAWDEVVAFLKSKGYMRK